MNSADPACDGIIGTWRWFNGATVTCGEDGLCRASNGFSGPWRCVEAPGTFEIRWGRSGQEGLFIDTLQLSSGGEQLAGKNQFGAGVSASRESVGPVKAGAEIEASQFPTAPSAQQQELVLEFGWPQSFLVTFATEENNGSLGKFRYETWYYYNMWTSFSFINGVFIGSEGIDRFEGDVEPLSYTPYDFIPGSEWSDVQRLVGGQKVVRLTPQDLAWDDVEGAEHVSVYFAGRIIAGFDERGLTLILALPEVMGHPQP